MWFYATSKKARLCKMREIGYIKGVMNEKIMEKILVEQLQQAIKSLWVDDGRIVFENVKIEVTTPKSNEFGDYTTNIAMVLAKQVGNNPMEIAEMIKKVILKSSDDKNSKDFERIEIAKPGYINFYFSQNFLQSVVKTILAQGEQYGVGEQKNITINNEFISANPTGPLTVGNGRGGFFGDALTKVLRKAGYEVTSEYYVNDAGNQVIKLGHSVLKDSESVYGGEYIDDLEQRFGQDKNAEVKTVGKQSAQYMLREYIQKTTREKMKIEFDVWALEEALYADGWVDKAIEELRKKNFTFEEGGALWFRSTDFGDDKDRVLVKQDGVKTYFASDCGYILYKKSRGFKKLIETWGADHHGYINRFRAAAEALGYAIADIQFLIVQLVKVMKDGKEVRMSKRAGNVVLIDDLIDTVGHDVARFFFLMYSPDTHMNFDLGLAEERSQKNPVYYVQYAHARLANILAKAYEANIPLKGIQEINLASLQTPKELDLIRELMQFPKLVAEIAEDYHVHKLPHYAIRVADRFHSFYAECRVIDIEQLELTQSRLALVWATKIVLVETLRLIGVSAPDRM